jgi:hypothetical protein
MHALDIGEVAKRSGLAAFAACSSERCDCLRRQRRQHSTHWHAS